MRKQSANECILSGNELDCGNELNWPQPCMSLHTHEEQSPPKLCNTAARSPKRARFSEVLHPTWPEVLVPLQVLDHEDSPFVFRGPLPESVPVVFQIRILRTGLRTAPVGRTGLRTAVVGRFVPKQQHGRAHNSGPRAPEDSSPSVRR